MFNTGWAASGASRGGMFGRRWAMVSSRQQPYRRKGGRRAASVARRLSFCAAQSDAAAARARLLRAASIHLFHLFSFLGARGAPLSLRTAWYA